MGKILLYRIMSYDEEKRFKQGILTFEINDITCRESKVNTFDYGSDKNSELAYRKHFFLTIEDAYKYKRSCGIKRDVACVFSFPEEIVMRNIGLGRYVYGKYCLEVSIPYNEMLEFLNAKTFDISNYFENIIFDKHSFYVEKEEFIDEDESLLYKNLYKSIEDILLKFEEDGKINLNEATKYFDDNENKKALVEKIKKFYTH